MLIVDHSSLAASFSDVFPVPHHTSVCSHSRAVIFKAQIDKDLPEERHGTGAFEWIGHTLHLE